MNLFLFSPFGSKQVRSYSYQKVSEEEAFNSLGEHLLVRPFEKSSPPTYYLLSPTSLPHPKKRALFCHFPSSDSREKQHYLAKTEKVISELTDEEKVVLSRTMQASFGDAPKQEVALSLFQVAVKRYPNAYVYLFATDEEVWVGASPEKLGSWNGNSFETVSLAGTRLANSNPKKRWGEKEKQEQQLVTQYIAQTILNYTGIAPEVALPQTICAGKLEHLKTRISLNTSLSQKKKLHLIEALHPTPAVCGVPLKKALKTVTNTELYNRELYTGYLALFQSKKMEAFVNLRCLKLTDSGITFYVGGGITASSDPEAEWNETVNKSHTMLNLFDNITYA